MKILFVVNYFPVLSETFVLGQINALWERGYDVSILCIEAQTPDTEQFTEMEIRPYLDRTWIWQKPLFDNQLVMKLVRRSGRRLLATVSDTLTARKARNFDVIIAHFGGNGARMARASMPWRDFPPILTIFHGYDIGIPLKQGQMKQYGRLFRKGARFLPVSDHFGDVLAANGVPRSKITTHHMGVDTTAIPFQPSMRTKNGFRILSVCRLTEKKGTEYAIRALAEVSRADPALDWHYKIIGDGPLEESLMALAAQLGVRGRISFLGRQSHAQTKEHLKQCDLFLLPSVTAGNGDIEGIPVALMEAMAAGIPVLSSVHSGIPELISDRVHGRLTPERDVAALRDAVLDMASDPTGVVNMVEAARRKVEADFNKLHLDDEFERIVRAVA